MMTNSLRLSLAVAAAGLVGCGDTATVVLVDIQTRPAVRASADIEVTVSNEGSDLAESFDVEDATFPLTLSVTPTGREGDLTVSISAFDDDGLLVAQGTNAAAIVADEQVDLEVVLEPTDFLVNSSIAGSQQTAFGFDRNSRQVAVAPDDSFVITFLNDCAQLGRCDILGRLFGPDSAPSVNEITQDANEFIINLETQFTQVPSVVVGSSGLFFTWATEDQIRASLMTETGEHVLGSDIQISESALPSIDPRSAALPNGEFVSVWLDCSTVLCADDPNNTMTVRARLFGADGLPAVNPITGNTSAFDVSSTPEGFAEVPTVIATGEGRGFIVIWPARADPAAPFPDVVRGRIFAANGTPIQAEQLTLITARTPGSFVYGAQAAMVEGELAIAWGSGRVDGVDLVDGQLLYRRFSALNGAEVGGLATIVEDTAPVFAAPGLASRGDGAMAVTWHNDGGPGDDSGFGVFAQVFRTNGMRIGSTFSAATTTEGIQAFPAIAASSDAFVITWTDASGAPPDTDGSGVRARVVYPAVDVPNGERGQPCGATDDAVCGDGLVCIEDGRGEQLCHEACDPGASESCVTGGACTVEGELAGCVF